MIIEMDIKDYQIDKPTIYRVTDEGLTGYPALCIDRDSYARDMTIMASFQEYQGFIPYNFQIGKYTSIATGCHMVIDMNHDYMAPCQGRPREVGYIPSKQALERRGELIIGNDCWIGRDSTVMSGVTIHDGAVVAATSTVTKDVPPYAVVGGNPARVLKYRFDEQTIHKLQEIRWWNWNSTKLSEARELLVGNIQEFVNRYYQPEPTPQKPDAIRTEAGNIQYLYFMDTIEQFHHLNYIMGAFCEHYEHTAHELMLCCKSEEIIEHVILPVLDHYQKYDVAVNLYLQKDLTDEDLIAQTDIYITSNWEQNMRRMSACEYWGIQILSGFNVPLFGWEIKT